MFPYQADSDFELSLSVGDYVVIREVSIQIKAYKIPFFRGSGHRITERILKLFFFLISVDSFTCLYDVPGSE